MKFFKRNLQSWSNWIIETTLQDKLNLTLLNSWFARNTTDIKNSSELHQAIGKIKKKKRVILIVYVVMLTTIRLLTNHEEDIDPTIIGQIFLFGLAIIIFLRSSIKQKPLFDFKKDYEEVFEILDSVPAEGINSKTTRRELLNIAHELIIEYHVRYLANKETLGENHEVTKASSAHAIEKCRLFIRFSLSGSRKLDYFREAEDVLAKRRLENVV